MAIPFRIALLGVIHTHTITGMINGWNGRHFRIHTFVFIDERGVGSKSNIVTK
jgi:hypothetical protein